ncbi:hypothetical protein AB0C90_39740 [Streptomyces sp. NPDC048550]|uniref:hypothetical protein n=1 Tax=Streptomyces sp. NPDC048550 TaxID=3155739 RepID=UPI00341A29CA
MSFEEEWVADKAAVTMKLDQADSTGGSTLPSGSADYVVEDDDLGEIGHAAHGVHQILGKNIDGHTTFNDLDIDRGDLTRVIRGVAEDPKAFGVIKGLQANELDLSPGEYEDGLQPTAEQWYQAGIKDADLKMGER